MGGEEGVGEEEEEEEEEEGEGGKGEGAGKLRNSEVKLRWVVVGGGMRGFSRQIDFVDLVNYTAIEYSLLIIQNFP